MPLCVPEAFEHGWDVLGDVWAKDKLRIDLIVQECEDVQKVLGGWSLELFRTDLSVIVILHEVLDQTLKRVADEVLVPDITRILHLLGGTSSRKGGSSAQGNLLAQD